MSGLLIEELQFIKGIDPVADAHAGGVTSDVIDMSEFSRIVFLSYRGVASGGTAAGTFTVEACDDTTPSNVSAIPFHYRKDGAAVAAAASTGVQVAAGSSKIDVFEVREDALSASGYRYIRLKIAETVNDPVVACVLVFGQRKSKSSAAYPDATD